MPGHSQRDAKLAEQLSQWQLQLAAVSSYFSDKGSYRSISKWELRQSSQRTWLVLCEAALWKKLHNVDLMQSLLNDIKLYGSNTCVIACEKHIITWKTGERHPPALYVYVYFEGVRVCVCVRGHRFLLMRDVFWGWEQVVCYFNYILSGRINPTELKLLLFFVFFLLQLHIKMSAKGWENNMDSLSKITVQSSVRTKMFSYFTESCRLDEGLHASAVLFAGFKGNLRSSSCSCVIFSF